MTEVVVVTQAVTEVVEVAGTGVTVSVTEAPVTVEVSNQRGPQGADGAAGPPGVVPVFSTVGVAYIRTGTHRFYVERASTLTKVRAAVGTPATGSPITVAVRVNGTVVSTVSIPAGDYTNTSTPAVALAVGDYLTVDITAVGSTTSGADLTVSATIE